MHTDLSNRQQSAPLPLAIWKARDGSVPFFDDPTFTIEMLKWNREPDTTYDAIYHRVLRGEISKEDIEIAITLARAKVLTEKQIRYLYRNAFPQAYKLATRLRFLQRIGWYEGWRIESQFNGREHVWSIGIAAKNYLGYGLGMEVPDPIRIAQTIRNCLPFCAINELRIRLVEKGVLQPDGFMWYPPLAPNYDSPMALIPIQTPLGKMVMYVERLQQDKKPSRFMERKIKQYLLTVQEQGALFNPVPNSMDPILVWSCGTEESIREIVGVQKRFPTEFMQLFIVDEFMDNLRGAWRIAIRGDAPGDVKIKPFDMDFL